MSFIHQRHEKGTLADVGAHAFPLRRSKLDGQQFQGIEDVDQGWHGLGSLHDAVTGARPPADGAAGIVGARRGISAVIRQDVSAGRKIIQHPVGAVPVRRPFFCYPQGEPHQAAPASQRHGHPAQFSGNILTASPQTGSAARRNPGTDFGGNSRDNFGHRVRRALLHRILTLHPNFLNLIGSQSFVQDAFIDRLPIHKRGSCELLRHGNASDGDRSGDSQIFRPEHFIKFPVVEVIPEGVDFRHAGGVNRERLHGAHVFRRRAFRFVEDEHVRSQDAFLDGRLAQLGRIGRHGADPNVHVGVEQHAAHVIHRRAGLNAGQAGQHLGVILEYAPRGQPPGHETGHGAGIVVDLFDQGVQFVNRVFVRSGRTGPDALAGFRRNGSPYLGPALIFAVDQLRGQQRIELAVAHDRKPLFAGLLALPVADGDFQAVRLAVVLARGGVEMHRLARSVFRDHGVVVNLERGVLVKQLVIAAGRAGGNVRRNEVDQTVGPLRHEALRENRQGFVECVCVLIHNWCSSVFRLIQINRPSGAGCHRDRGRMPQHHLDQLVALAGFRRRGHHHVSAGSRRERLNAAVGHQHQIRAFLDRAGSAPQLHGHAPGKSGFDIGGRAALVGPNVHHAHGLVRGGGAAYQVIGFIAHQEVAFLVAQVFPGFALGYCRFSKDHDE
nr:MAG TPA: hypothetical protein [Caudoviricetes sp.]